MIVVEKGTPGVEITGVVDTIGHRAAITPRIEFHERSGAGREHPRPARRRDGAGPVRLLLDLCPDRGRLRRAMRAAFDYAYEFARTDNRSGPHPVIEYQNVGLHARRPQDADRGARYLTWKTADHFDKTDGKIARWPTS